MPDSTIERYEDGYFPEGFNPKDLNYNPKGDGDILLEDIINTGGGVVNTGLETGGEILNTGLETGGEIVTTGLETGEELVGEAVDGTQEILSAGVNLARTTTQDTGKFMLVIGIGLMIPFIMSKI